MHQPQNPTGEIIWHFSPTGPSRIDRQVSVLRAAQKVVAADPDWIACRIEGQGRGWVFLNLANVQSYTLGRIIIDTSNVYRSKKRAQRQPGQWVGAGPGFRRKIVDDHRDIVPDRAELLASCCYGPPNELYAKQVAYHSRDAGCSRCKPRGGPSGMARGRQATCRSDQGRSTAGR